MIHGVPWGTLSHGPLREGLVTLSERMDLGVSGDRSLRAYVALRMIATRFVGAEKGTDMSIHLSPEATVALAEELATMPDLSGLRDRLLVQLQQEPEDEGPRTYRHNRATVRESRHLRFQR